MDLIPLSETLVVDFTQVLDALAAVQVYQQEHSLAILVLAGVVLGCTISLILAVMFK